MDKDIECNSLPLPVINGIDGYGQKRLDIKNIRFYNSVIVCLRNSIMFVSFRNGVSITINPHSVCYFEKNMTFDVKLIILDNHPYDIIHLNSNIVASICKAMSPVALNNYKNIQSRTKVFSREMDDIDMRIFSRIITQPPQRNVLIYKLAYILSKFESFNELLNSLFYSTNKSFVEKVKEIIETDYSKSWRLIDLTCILHQSEITIRKKLEKESTTFNKLLLDIKMHRAARLITTTEKQICVIADDVGYASTSYFIKAFKDYYGLTPKQFSLQLKNRNLN